MKADRKGEAKAKRSTWIWGLAGAAAVLALLVWAFALRPVAVQLAAVTLGRFETSIDEDGRTRLAERHTVSAPLAGRLSHITLRECDPLAAGAPVALLTPVLPALQDVRSQRELAARIEAARKEVESVTAEQHVASHEVAQARAALGLVHQPATVAGDAGAMVVRAPVAGQVLRGAVFPLPGDVGPLSGRPARRPGTPCSWSAPAGRGWCRWCWPVATATRPGCTQAWRRARWSSSTGCARCATPASRARRPGVAQSVAVLTPPSFPPAAAVPLSRRQAQAALLALAGGLLPGPAWPAPAPDEPAVADWRQRFEAAVDRRIMVPVDAQRHYLELLQSALAQAGIGALVPQALLLVDRSLQVQAAFVLLGLGEGRWSWLGATPVSTGRVGTFDHFRTPLGVFVHSLDNPDFRAEGTFNENHIRGYGLRGMRVFDFGWVQAERGWGAGGTSTMRLQMHATDPAVLEPRLGRAESKGCIRIPATLNSFIDRHGLLDSDYQAAAALGRAPWVLRADRAPIPWPGRYLVVVDSARSQRPPWAPGPATRR